MVYNYNETHKNIRENAKNFFLKKGYLKTNLREICKASGVTNGAFYKHFKSKNDLFLDIVEPFATNLNKMYLDTSTLSLNSIRAGSFIKAIKVVDSQVKEFLKYIYANVDAFKLLVYKSEGTSYDNFLENFINLSVNISLKVFEEAKERKLIKNTVSRRTLHLLTHSYFTFIAECIKNDYSIEETEKEVDILIDFFVAGWMKILF